MNRTNQNLTGVSELTSQQMQAVNGGTAPRPQRPGDPAGMFGTDLGESGGVYIDGVFVAMTAHALSALLHSGMVSSVTARP